MKTPAVPLALNLSADLAALQSTLLALVIAAENQTAPSPEMTTYCRAIRRKGGDLI